MLEEAKEWFGQATSKLARMSVSGGVVGKISRVLIWYLISIPAIVWAGKSETVLYVAMGLPSVIVSVILWRMMDFAIAHPEIALLDGAEYLEHEQIQFKFQSPDTNISVIPSTNPRLPAPPLDPPPSVDDPDDKMLGLPPPQENDEDEDEKKGGDDARNT